MSDTVIQVDSLSKRYRLGIVGTRTLHHDFERWWARVRGKPDPFLKIGQEQRPKPLPANNANRHESFAPISAISGQNAFSES